MAVESDSDRASFFADFGETFVLAGQVEIEAIYDELYGDEIGVEGLRPSVLVRTIDVADLGQGSQLVRKSDSQIFAATNIRPDSTGITRIFLEKN